MKNSNKKQYEGALLEEMDSKIDRIAEILIGLVEEVRVNSQKLANVESDMSVVKSVLMSHSTELKNHRSRIHKLETTVYS